jgi:inorganic pyrophosphatase
MSNFWVEQVNVATKKSKTMESFEMIKVGKNFLMEYSVSGGKIRIKRVVKVVGEDNVCYYVNTGYLTNIAIYKDDIVDAVEV